MAEPAELTAEDLSEWSTVITPARGWFDLRLAQVWEYRDLIYLFFRRDFVASYKQTILGPFWFFAQPVMTTLVFWVIFGRIGKIVTKGVPQFLFFMAGIILWNFFSSCLIRTATTFTANSGLFGKVYFPRLTVPLSVVLTNLATFGFQFVMFLAFFAVAWWLGVPVHPNWRLIILPVLLLEMAALAIGVGCIVAALTVRYRDFAVIIQFGVQLWMYASCVVFPLALIEPKTRIWFILNPMVPIIESFRYAFIGYGVIQLWELVLSMGITLVLFFGGIVMFSRVERTHLDSI
ncbi:MAG: ABC-type polysaccharide/polyol phosphate export system, permease component [Chthoniobacter sp.]|jgi:lipopolysaccharide transport system permease protein|nr:ABC-type polysaccharide/polyol phosphate export system, permease component [Chthoniobacter sp.]